MASLNAAEVVRMIQQAQVSHQESLAFMAKVLYDSEQDKPGSTVRFLVELINRRSAR